MVFEKIIAIRGYLCTFDDMKVFGIKDTVNTPISVQYKKAKKILDKSEFSILMYPHCSPLRKTNFIIGCIEHEMYRRNKPCCRAVWYKNDYCITCGNYLINEELTEKEYIQELIDSISIFDDSEPDERDIFISGVLTALRLSDRQVKGYLMVDGCMEHA